MFIVLYLTNRLILLTLQKMYIYRNMLVANMADELYFNSIKNRQEFHTRM